MKILDSRLSFLRRLAHSQDPDDSTADLKSALREVLSELDDHREAEALRSAEREKLRKVFEPKRTSK